MNQIMLDIPNYGPWILTHKGDSSCRLLADRHYSRQTIGHPMFTRPGRNLVLRTALGNAVWVTWSGIRDDGLDAWECAVFRNESNYLSSFLIKLAVDATIGEWGTPPVDGIITYVDPKKINSVNPGCCFKKAGWQRIGKSSKRGLILLQVGRG
ncbi:hypothetical protein ERICIV_00871 [Paenibacillus larvae subsp. larvae]|uniref:Uncharacterized protein n=1 Tax=Paenibacillus larvae subsp. larvae TaxID=147375 RepID=A0A2L1TWM6_9BACL|nr:hypothetical protein [Paenibacillus larvae]AQT85673.1 hypothetical protein B1222_16700 [Paenibacillus larvae subsp. pulvifaciens]AVF25075.1 hypothetical protein ERICIII_00868 [Paenibacillus larvae subsp. larvae]AVF29839.1 hypothetical protein ERICIV_00871 [Paenibacillus larvae subsp. larvae]MCY7522363.1 hypothetical protein [Paenibacillus larvae]MCY9500173.1 hypothetical protein [Paenibacillus larvae]